MKKLSARWLALFYIGLLQEVFGKSVNIVYYLTYSDLFAVFHFTLFL